MNRSAYNMAQGSSAMRAALLVLLALAVPARSEIKGLRTVASGGERWVTLADVASFYGMRAPPALGRMIPLRSEWSSLEFEADGRKMLYNGMLAWLHAPTTKVRYRWAVAETDMASVVDPLVRPMPYLAGRRAHVVVLDPGHGGKDRGARGWRAVEEARVVLDVAKRARVMLANEGVRVYLTRDGDRYLDLWERGRLAAGWGADVFVSIHMNSSGSSTPTGIETYVLAAPGYPSTNTTRPGRTKDGASAGNRHEAANTILGYHLHRNLVNKLRQEDRGLRRARFVVLKEAACPAALVECGFVSNRREAEQMISSQYRENIARAVAQGVLDYISAVKRANEQK